MVGGTHFQPVKQLILEVQVPFRVIEQRHMLLKVFEAPALSAVHGRVPQRQPHVVPRKIVGKGVVDRGAAVFVRTFYKEAGILVPVRLPGKAAEPVARRFQIQLRQRPVQRAVAGNLAVAVRRVGHIGCDVRFAQADIPAFALLAPVLAAHPRIARAA